MSTSDPGYIAAVEEQIAGEAEGGIPIGGSLVDDQGNIIGRGRNMRKQNGSVILHAETAAFENAKDHRDKFKGATLYTTLSPCPMCAGAAVWYQVARVVIAENNNEGGQEEWLKSKGVDVVVLNDKVVEERLTKYYQSQSRSREEH